MEHNLNDISRGDFASQTAGLETVRNIGVYHANDCMRALRQNPIPLEEGGNIRTVQGAMIPLTALLLTEDGNSEPSSPNSGERGASEPFDRLAPAFRRL